MPNSHSLLKGRAPSNIIKLIQEIRFGSNLNAIGTKISKTRISWHANFISGALPEDPYKKIQLKIKLPPLDLISRLGNLNLIPDEAPEKFTKELRLNPCENQDDAKHLLQELVENVVCISTKSRDLGLGQGHLRNERVIVEFGSPNIAKPLHMGHLRSTVTGHFVARICSAAGHRVTSMCFLGDWGTQFGLLQAGLVHWLKAESIERTVNKMDLRSLLDYYIRAAKEQETNDEFAKEAREYSAALERQDFVALNIWATIREKTVQHLGTVWNQFGIQYDVIQGESEFAIRSDHTESAISELKEKGRAETAEDGCTYGTIPIPGNRENKTTRIPLVKADGSSLYLLRDIAAARSRAKKFPFDRMIYVVDKAQTNHFLALFSLLSPFGFTTESELIPPPDTQRLQHVSFGRVEGMSTRSGNFVLLSDVIRDGSALMEDTRRNSENTRRQENDEVVSTKLAISALIVHSLKMRRNKDVKFDWEEALRPVGETGVRLQYTHARLRSLELKQGFNLELLSRENFVQQNLNYDYILSDPVALELALHLSNFDDGFWASYESFEPCILLTYLFKLCDKTSKALKELKVQTESDQSIAQTRLILFALSRKVLAVGLDVIGIEPLDQI